MPRGMIIIRWDDKFGAILEHKYPDNLEITQEQVMRIFTTHALGDAKPGFLSMKIEDLNVASYYTGVSVSTNQYCISLILDSEEDADIYEEILSEVASDLLRKIDDPNFSQILIKEYEKISKLTKIEIEQRYAMIFSDNLRLLVLNKLTEEPITRTELLNYIEEQSNLPMLDFDILIAPLIKTGLVKSAFVEGIPDECYFLVRDIIAVRGPVENLLNAAKAGELPGGISSKYLNLVESFFKNYTPSIEDSSNISKLIINYDYYSLLKLLREKPVKHDELKEVLSLDNGELNKILDDFKKNNLIEFISDSEGKTWVILISDIKFITFFPEYLIDVIRSKWNEGNIDQSLAIKHLNLLNEEYLGK